jgi:NADH:ubiquinone oxidoreductase subunit K
MSPVQVLFVGAWFLLIIGSYGLMVAQSLLKVVIALRLMVKGAIIMLVVVGSLRGQLALGQTLALTVITVDTLVAVIGLALVVQVKIQRGTLDVDRILNTEG